MASPSPKAAHYNAALTSALLRGGWGDANPGKAPNGTDLSWSELIRKWGKHTGGNTSLIHHIRDISLYLSSAHSSTSSSGFITVPASQSGVHGTPTSNQVQNSSANSSSTDDSHASTATGSSFIHIPHPHIRKHKASASTDAAAPGSTAGLSASVTGDTLATTDSGSTALGQGRARETTGGSFSRRPDHLSASDLDGDDPAEEDFWQVGGAWWSGVSEEQVDEVQEGIKALSASLQNGKLSPGEVESTRITLAIHQYGLGRHAEALDTLQQLRGDSVTGVLNGDAAVAERIRAKCAQGISLELSGASPQDALNCYLSAIPLLSSISGFTLPTPSYLSSTGQRAKLPFDTHREVHRQISTILSRSAVLSARSPNNLNQTIRICRTYHAFAASWPTTFRPIQRQRMLSLYLRALFSSVPAPHTQPLQPYSLDETPTPSLSARTLWRKEAIEAIRLGQSLLSATTSFPKAGSVNKPVNEFIELAVALADRTPSLSRDVISVLWWAMNLTFESQSLLRHLTRLLAAVGDSTDARRVFELYVTLVLKARQTHRPEMALKLQRRPTEDGLSEKGRAETKAEGSEEELPAKAGQSTETSTEKPKGQNADSELETDEDFVEALLVGSRLLLKDLGEAEEAWRYVSLAGDVLDVPGDLRGSNRRLVQARVEECKGIVRMAMGMRGSDPETRPVYQAQAINHLKTSASLQPSSTVHYHLAYCQAEARSIDAAIASIRKSFEADSKHVQAWHLLALLLSAQGDWDGASKAAEAGVSVWEEDEAVDVDEEDGNAGGAAQAGVSSRDFADTSGNQEEGSTLSEAILLPSGAFQPSRLRSNPSLSSPATRAQRLGNVIRLRMTLDVIAEKTQGPDGAMARQQELFAFFSARSGKNRATGATGPLTRGLVVSDSVSSVPGGEDGKGLGGSYISINVNTTGPPVADMSNSISIQPPTPNVESTPQVNPILATSRHSPSHNRSANTSAGNSTISSENESPDDQDRRSMISEKSGRRGLGKKLGVKHLHVPHSLGKSSRPSSVRRLNMEAQDQGQRGDRVVSTSSAVSIAPTAVHSHYRRSEGMTPPPPPPSQAAQDHSRTAEESRILSNLWLMSAATFRRWSKLEQCLVAIEEAEVLDPENPDVWVQLGLYHVSISPPSSNTNNDSPLAAFTKAILLRPNHPPGLVNLAKLYFSTGQVELAHSLLNQITQDFGWDVPEAWYYLGKVCELQGRIERSRECWKYALGLEETRPVRSWSDGVDRWL